MIPEVQERAEVKVKAEAEVKVKAEVVRMVNMETYMVKTAVAEIIQMGVVKIRAEMQVTVIKPVLKEAVKVTGKTPGRI
jgi:hypothetical protein